LSYNPEAFGAQCSKCMLRVVRDGPVVGPEMNRYARACVIGEAPAKEDCEEGRPFIGAAGRELTVSLGSIGVARDHVSFVNAMACRPPGNDLELLLHKGQQANKKREAMGQEPFLDPIRACRPRLYAEIGRFDKLVTVGKYALRAVTGGMQSIMEVRGAPMTGVLVPDPQSSTGSEIWLPRETLDHDPDDHVLTLGGRFVRVLPAFHPSFVLRQRRWTKVFRADLARAFRWFDNRLGWVEPNVIYTPSYDEIRRYLYRPGIPFYTYDVETDAKESLIARLRCIGIGTPHDCIVIPFLSIDGYSKFYPDDEMEAIKDLLRAWFTDPKILKTGWNAGSYDRVVMECQIGITPAPLVDGMIIHRNVDSELPHGLAFVGSLFTDVKRAWKASHAATQSASDRELHEYNAGDVVVNARIMEPLYEAVKMRGQEHVAAVDHKNQATCVGLHKNGIYVDQVIRRQLDEKYRKEAKEHLHILRMSIGDPGFNPNSVYRVRDLLFNDWKLTPLETTKLGDPSTNDDTLRKLLLLRTLKEPQKDFLRSLRKYRRAAKFRGTFIRPLRPFDEPLYPDDDAIDVSTPEGAALMDEVVDATAREAEEVLGKAAGRAIREAMKGKAGLVLADGRVHSSWNAHVATTGRKSSSEPNVQNIVRALRAMFTAEPGRMLAACDYDQLELRISADFAGASRYLEAFQDPNGDPHSVTAESLYGATFRNGSEKDRKRIRDFAKRFVYAVIYGATVETIHETIASAENDRGELIFPWVTLRETDTLVRRWMKENHEYGQWWEDTIATYRRDGFLAEPVLGRRRFFLDGEDRNEIINYRVQAAGASCVTKAEIALTEGPLPFEKWGPGTGLIQNGHDALMAEAPCKCCGGKQYAWPKGAKMRKGIDVAGHPPLAPGQKCPIVDAALAITEAMTMTLPGGNVKLTATPKIGFAWSEV
jgi:DNA polymerase I-like protein with 3'-5' exonuclease and polymerase domains/uracil-DNA glycosylase